MDTLLQTPPAPCGAGYLAGADGAPAITSPTGWDCHVIARLQDIEDHPDALGQSAA